MTPARFLPALARRLSSIAAPIAVSSLAGPRFQSPFGKSSSGLLVKACMSRSNSQAAMVKLPSATSLRAAGCAALRARVNSSQRVRPLGPSATDILSEASANTTSVPCCRAFLVATNVGRNRQATIPKKASNRSMTNVVRRRRESRERSGPTKNNTATSSVAITTTNDTDPTESMCMEKSLRSATAIMRLPRAVWEVAVAQACALMPLRAEVPAKAAAMGWGRSLR